MNWTQFGSDINGTATQNRAGKAVAISQDGLVMAIGAPSANGSTGQVRIFKCTSAGWVQMGQTLLGKATGNEFGVSVSLSSDGTSVSIGAAGGTGYVQVYQWTDDEWKTKGEDMTGNSDQFGCSVSMDKDGGTVAIGVYGAGQESTGQVQVYEWTDGAWVLKGRVIDGEATKDYAGYSVSVNGDGSIVAIGAPRTNEDLDKLGNVRVYRWSDGEWRKMGDDIDGPSDNSMQGDSLDLNDAGTTLVIGAPWDQADDRGSARVFDWEDGWVQRGQAVNGQAGDQAGSSVSISADGNVIAVGAGWNDATDNNAGQVRVFEWAQNAWTQRGDAMNGKAAGNHFGNAVALNGSGDLVIIGAPKASFNGATSGQVVVFKYRADVVEQMERGNTRNLQKYRKRVGGRYSWRR